MIKTDEDALICDLAETYGVFDYRSLPVSLVATFSVGLRDNSRIKMKMAGTKIDMTTALLALCVDRLSFLWWAKTKDAEKGINRPKSVFELLNNQSREKKEKENVSFVSGEDFEATRNKILKQINGG